MALEEKDIFLNHFWIVETVLVHSIRDEETPIETYDSYQSGMRARHIKTHHFYHLGMRRATLKLIIPTNRRIRVGTLHLNIPTNHEWGKSHCILSQTTGQPRKVAIAHLGMRQYLFFNVSASTCHRASSASIIKSFWCGTNFLHQRLTSTICSLLKHFYGKFSMLLYSTVRRDSMDVNSCTVRKPSGK